MSDINRRKLIGAVGAGLTLSAYGTKVDAAEGVKEDRDCFDFNKFKSNLLMTGTFFPNEAAYTRDSLGRQVPYKYEGKFEPRHICIVYMKFESGKITVKHAHFVKPASDFETNELVRMQLTHIHDKKTWTGHVPHSEGENFDNWGFGSQSIIYIGLGNGPEVMFDRDNKLQFAFFSARWRGGAKVPKHENNSFWNSIVDNGIWSGHEILMIQNWYVDEVGNQISSNNKRYYSMNIHLNMAFYNNDIQGGEYYIPLVVDPDTGNMGSNP